MIKIQIQGEIFELEPKDIIGSVTINNLLQYYTGEDGNSHGNITIPLGLSIETWYQYLDFLDYNQPTIGALRVIDYIDNVSQTKIWCLLYYKLLRKQYGSNHNDTIKDTLIKIVSDNTQYIPYEVLPFNLLDTFETMLPRIKEMSTTTGNVLPHNNVKHIINTLFSPYIANIVNNINNIKHTLYDVTNGYVNKIISKRLILRSLTGGHEVLNSEIILHYDDDDYYNFEHASYPLKLIGETAFISPRIAAHYQNINVYDIGYENFIYCPDNKSYLQYWLDTQNVNYIMQASCSNNNNITSILTVEPLSKMTNTKKYNIHNKYIPYEGHQTEITITSKNNSYKLLCYNIPSTYDRDYYIYLPYEYDPIIKVIYAFSV